MTYNSQCGIFHRHLYKRIVLSENSWCEVPVETYLCSMTYILESLLNVLCDYSIDLHVERDRKGPKHIPFYSRHLSWLAFTLFAFPDGQSSSGGEQGYINSFFIHIPISPNYYCHLQGLSQSVFLVIMYWNILTRCLLYSFTAKAITLESL